MQPSFYFPKKLNFTYPLLLKYPMPQFKLTFQPYPQSPSFDVIIMATEVDVPADLIGAMQSGKEVTLRVQVDTDATQRPITIAKLRGDLDITVPRGWICQSNSRNFVLGGGRHPRVTLITDDQKLWQTDGFITQYPLWLRFEKLPDTLDSDVEGD